MQIRSCFILLELTFILERTKLRDFKLQNAKSIILRPSRVICVRSVVGHEASPGPDLIKTFRVAELRYAKILGISLAKNCHVTFLAYLIG